jgi:hypothetical protein
MDTIRANFEYGATCLGRMEDALAIGDAATAAFDKTSEEYGKYQARRTHLTTQMEALRNHLGGGSGVH